jgi:hypothetical protein
MTLMVLLIAHYYFGLLPTADCQPLIVDFMIVFLLIAKVRRAGVDPLMPFCSTEEGEKGCFDSSWELLQQKRRQPNEHPTAIWVRSRRRVDRTIKYDAFTFWAVKKCVIDGNASSQY